MAVPLSGVPVRRHLVIFLKAPRLGRVKRRLADDIGAVAAWSFYRRTTERLIRRLASDPRWRTTLAVTPERAVRDGCRWPRIARTGQGSGDLGERMFRALRRPPPGPVVLVGGDIPELRPHHVAHAFRLLRDSDFVFGPAVDGGFWLVGARRRPRFPYPFAGVRWSHPGTLAETLAAVPPGQRVALADRLADVDDGDALRRWKERGLSRPGGARAPAGEA